MCRSGENSALLMFRVYRCFVVNAGSPEFLELNFLLVECAGSCFGCIVSIVM